MTPKTLAATSVADFRDWTKAWLYARKIENRWTESDTDTIGVVFLEATPGEFTDGKRITIKTGDAALYGLVVATLNMGGFGAGALIEINFRQLTGWIAVNS